MSPAYLIGFDACEPNPIERTSVGRQGNQRIAMPYRRDEAELVEGGEFFLTPVIRRENASPFSLTLVP